MGRFVDVPVQGHDRRVGGKGHLAGEHLVQHDAEGIDIGPAVDGLHEGVFGRHVLRRADAGAGARQARRLVQHLGDAEIGQQGTHVPAHQNVAGFDVAVDQALLVRMVQRSRQLGGDRDRKLGL